MLEAVKAKPCGGRKCGQPLQENLGWLGRVKSLIAEFHPQIIDYPAAIRSIESQGFRYIPDHSASDFDSMDTFIHAHQFKRANRSLRKLKTYLGRVIRDIERRIVGNEDLREAFVRPLFLARRCMSSEHFGQLAWQFKRMSGSSGLKVQAAIAC